MHIFLPHQPLMAPPVKVELHILSHSACLPRVPPRSLEVGVCSEALAQTKNTLTIYSGQNGFLAFLGTSLSSVLPKLFIVLVLAWCPSPPPAHTPYAWKPKVLGLLPLCDLEQYGRLTMGPNSLPSSFVRGDDASRLIL